MAEQHRQHGESLEERRGRDRKVWRYALFASFVLHALIFAIWTVGKPLPASPFAAAGPRSGDDRAAAGGAMQAMNVAPPRPQPITPPPLPTPTLEPVEMVDFEPEPMQEMASMMGDPGQQLGPPGLEDGEGEGDGGTAEAGNFRLVPPSPRGLIIPPSNDELRGREVQVWVFVDERGRVVPDSTRLEPPTGDRSLNRQLIQEAAQWIFEPARRGGAAVAAWFPYTISM